MATITTDLICNLNQPVAATFLHGNLFSQDNAGNTINVHVMDNGEPATIGGTVSANVIRADGNTVAVSGSLSGNQCSVVLPQACYAVPGRVEIIIKLTQSTTITTIAAIVANVYRSTTDTVVDPGTIIPSIQALIEEIEDAVDSIPVDYSGLLATIAADYSSSKTYPVVGMYAWQGGVLKRNIVPITTAETYTAAHWTNAVIGDDLSALKSAFDDLDNRGYILDGIYYQAWELGQRYVDSGEEKWTSSSSRMSTKRGTYINFNAGDIVVLKNTLDYQFLVGYSTNNGSTWSGGSNRTSPLTIESDSIGFICIKKASGTFTDDEIKNVAKNKIFILRDGTNIVNGNEQKIDAVTMAMASFNNSEIVAVDFGMMHTWVSANATSVVTSNRFTETIPAVVGDMFAIKAEVSISYPLLYTGIGIVVYEVSSGDTVVKTTYFTDISDVIEYEVTHSNAAKISIFGYLTAESGSITTGYNEIFDYKLNVAKQMASDLEIFLTENGETWEV